MAERHRNYAAASSTAPWRWTTPSTSQAARTKGIISLVAGHANVLIVPNLEAGNMLAKELTFMAQAEAAGIVLRRPGADHADQPRR